MMLKDKKEAKRLEEILKGYTSGRAPVSATFSFVKEFLNPQPDRYDLTYRYEHSDRKSVV